MRDRLKKNKALAGILATLVAVGIGSFAFAGKGTKTISSVVDNGDTSYYVIVDATSGITVGDHFGAKVADGSGGVWAVSAVGTAVLVTDTLTEENGGTYGAPVAGSAWYSTPSTNIDLSKPPYQGVGWDAPLRRNAHLVETVLGPTSGLYGISEITTAATGDLFVYGGTNYDKWTLITPGTSGYVLTSNGASSLPTWQAAGGGSNALLDGSSHSDTAAAAVTRGSLIYGDSTPEWNELTIGSANTVLFSDGTDVSWGTLTAALDGAIGSTRGSILYRGASGWAILTPGTSGDVLTSQGAGADPQYATPGGGSTHAMLSTTHTDSVTATVARGDVMVANSTPAWDALTVGAANTVLGSDGTDTTFRTLTATIDGAFSSTQGSILYRNGSAWVALGPGTSGHYLETQGAGANPQWSAVAGGGTNALLDGSSHTDTTAQAVTRGSIIVGNATPAWDEVTVGAANTIVGSDGTDTTFRTLTATMDGAFGSTQGQILFRGASNWEVLATGTAGYTLVSGGAGADVAWVDSRVNSHAYIHLEDQKSSGTNGGTCTTGSWQTRTLNTEVSDDTGSCTLSSNQFTLAAGTYEIEASAPGFAVGSHKIRLQNTTDATTIRIGTTAYQPTSGSTQNRSFLRGRFTIGASKALEIQHYSSATLSSQGFGVASSLDTEVYTIVTLRRVE